MAERQTLQKALVLHTVRTLVCHPSAEDVYRAIAATHPAISRATVYRNLGRLAAGGEIRRVEVPGAADRFDFNLTRHYHIHCRQCGGVFDIDMPYMDDLTARVQDAGGFAVEGYELVFRGVCPACRTAQAHAS